MQKQQSPAPLAALALISALSLPLSGCASTPSATAEAPAAAPTPAPLPSGENVALGQRAYVDGPIIEPAAILEDSRCPQNARCVWAGRLKLQMIWHRGNGEAQPFELTLGQPTHIADGSIQITAATPPRLAEAKPIPHSDYRFSFRFDGGY